MTNPTDLPETYYTDVVGCSRCNGHHPSLLFKKFSQQPASFAAGITHWAMCPVNNEPILLEMTEDPPSPQPIEKQDNIDALLTAFHHAYSAYGWVTHQQFSPLFDEAARLAGIVEEDWDASVYPFNTQAQAAAVLSDHHHNLVRQVATEGQIRGAVLYLISTKHLDIIDPPPAIKYAIEYAIARWGVPATTPVPTGDDSAWRQQLGWCNSNGECWWSPGPQGPWQLINPNMVYPAGWLLPYRAISQPAPVAGQVEP